MFKLVYFLIFVLLSLVRESSSDTVRIGPWPVRPEDEVPSSWDAHFNNRQLTMNSTTESPVVTSAIQNVFVEVISPTQNAQNVPSITNSAYSPGVPPINYYPSAIVEPVTPDKPDDVTPANLTREVPKVQGYSPGVPLTVVNSTSSNYPTAKALLTRAARMDEVDQVESDRKRQLIVSENVMEPQFAGTIPIAEIKPGPTVMGNFTKQTVTSDSGVCSEMGNSILIRGGNAVDAAITTLLCTGVVHPHDSGLGGSVLLNIHMHDSGKTVTVSGISTAPHSATENMFHSYPTGWMAIAIPGHLSGLREAHRQFGSVEWSVLFQPVISLARNGFVVDEDLAGTVQKNKEIIMADTAMRQTFLKDGGGENFVREGDVIRSGKLADVLQVIATDPCFTCEFYKHSIATALIADISGAGGILTKKDLFSHRASAQLSSLTNLTGGRMLATTLLPSAGSILSYMMQVLDEPTTPRDFDLNMPLHYHRRMEAEAFGFARFNEMGDPKFVPEMQSYVENLNSKWFSERTRAQIKSDTTYVDSRSYGISTNQKASHVVEPEESGSSVTVVDMFGNAVSSYAGIGAKFGSGKMSPSTGIILNNELSDFNINPAQNTGIPPNKANMIAPGKRPLKWVAPAIVFDIDGNVRSVAANAGGKQSFSALFQVMYHLHHAGYDIKMAVDQKSIHKSLNPLRLEYEQGFPKELARSLASMGHELRMQEPMSFSIQGIQVTNDGAILHSISSARKAVNSAVAGI